jgi:hypothetical protein
VLLAGLALAGCAESDLLLEHAEKFTAAAAANTWRLNAFERPSLRGTPSYRFALLAGPVAYGPDNSHSEHLTTWMAVAVSE